MTQATAKPIIDIEESYSELMARRRWYNVATYYKGQLHGIGKLECTGNDLRESVGAWAIINPRNGDCSIYGMPATKKRRAA